ncbi:uncharacterized protein LOC122623586 [Drosophila teissieri]|uniref:uncharacterized protein LOC122623586 n=1 Tax=Drosophila teissieri TaxID=7243 RepID=UPI001CBA171D|nr:uncharacterized protein LOC122623586 [Drosophila teissieri]
MPKVMITDNGVQSTIRAFKRKGQQDRENNDRAVHRGRSEDMGRELAGAAAGSNHECGGDHRILAVIYHAGKGTKAAEHIVRQTAGTGRCTQTPAENAEKLKEIFELLRRNMETAAQDQARHAATASTDAVATASGPAEATAVAAATDAGAAATAADAAADAATSPTTHADTAASTTDAAATAHTDTATPG